MAKGKARNLDKSEQQVSIKLSTEDYLILDKCASSEGKSVPQWIEGLLQPYIDKGREQRLQELAQENRKLKAELEQYKSKDSK